MAVPAEYYSDEDEDEFGFDDFKDEDDPIWKRSTENIHSRIDEKQFKLDKLFLDVVNGHITEIQEQLEDGLDSNLILKENWSLLLLAASVGNPEITKLLIERGADVNYDKDTYTVLMAACNCPFSCSPPEKSLAVVKQLLENGADVNAVTRRRMTALMYACSSGNLEVVKLLLPISNRIATDNQGWNALFWAVNDNKPEVVKFLLEAGFKETQLDLRNNTPVSYALLNGYSKVVALFPTRQDLDHIYNCFQNNNFNNFENTCKDLQKGERPQYLSELFYILCSSKSELHMSCFLDNNIGLNTFLSLTDKQLQTLGITLPFQRYKILYSIYRFHKHAYLPASIPSVQKNDVYSNMETAKSVAAALRQLVSMEATIDYLIANSDMFSDSIDKQAFEKTITSVRDKVLRMKRTTKALHQRARHWDDFNRSADLINKDSCKKKYPLKIKIVGWTLLPALVLVWKVVWAKM